MNKEKLNKKTILVKNYHLHSFSLLSNETEREKQREIPCLVRKQIRRREDKEEGVYTIPPSPLKVKKKKK